MEIDRQENGALIIRAYKGVPFYEAKWRDATKKQRKRRLGKAWLKQDSKGRWIKRRGRVPDGYLDQRRAYREMSRVIAEIEVEQQIGPRMREALFEDAVEVWLEHLELEKRAKPSTLAGYRSLLAKPETGDKRGAVGGSCEPSPAESWSRSRLRTSSASWRRSTASRSAPGP